MQNNPSQTSFLLHIKSMQYYTKQQLQGAGGYSPGVRVGNWNEEVNMQETKLKELLLKQQEGSLKLTR